MEYIDTEGGKAILFTEADVPGALLLLTDVRELKIPGEPETQAMRFRLRSEDADGASPAPVDIIGRRGLNLAYEEIVGYQPDADADEPLPIWELVELVAGAMLFRFKK